MKKWLDKYKSKGEVKNAKNPIKLKEVVIKANKPVYQYTPQNLVAPTFSNLSQTTYGVTPYGGTSKKLEVIKNNNKKRPKIKLQNQIFASNTRENVLDKRRNYYFPYETEQTKNIRNLADEKVFQSSGDLISAVHPVGAVINALVEGADQSLFAEGFRFLPNKVPFKNAKTYNSLIPFLKPASKAIDLIQMFDKLHTADSLYNSADSIDLYNQFKNGGLVSKNSLNRKVTCSNCGWSWKLSDGGEDPLTCHKCGGTIKMKHGGELDIYKDKGEVVNPNNPIQLPNVNFVYKRPVAKSTFNPYENVNRVSSSDGTRVFRLNPEQVENAKKAAAIRNEKIVKEYLQNQQSFIGPDNRTKAERDKGIALKKEYDRIIAMQNSDLAKTFASFTPGNNIEAGVMGAETFANLNPIISGPILATSRLAPAILHPTNNAYWGSDRSNLENGLGVLGAIGDITMISPYLKIPLAKTEQIVDNLGNKYLPDVSKYYPKRFKENLDSYYRQVFSPNKIENPLVTRSMVENNDPKGIDAFIRASEEKFIDAGTNTPFELLRLPTTESLPYFNKGKIYYGKNYTKNIKEPELLIESKVPFADYEDFYPAATNYVSVNPNQVNQALQMSKDVRVLSPFSEAGHNLENYNFYKPHWLYGYKKIKFPNIKNSSLENNRFNLVRNTPKIKKDLPSKEEVDLGNGLILENNPSRVKDKESILGTKRTLVSVKNTKTNEYIELRSWLDPSDNKIKYYFSAEMPSSKIKAGKAYAELEKHIPIGAEIKEPFSLSFDSFTNTIKQTKNPKFKTSIQGEITLNDSAVFNKLKNKGDSFLGDVFYKSAEKAQLGAEEINALLEKYNLPKAEVRLRENFNQQKSPVYEIRLPNISLKKLYTVLGISTLGALNQKQEGGAIITNRGQWDYPGQTTIIPSNQITMQGVPYPVTGVDNLGNTMVMQPGINYTFPGQYVTEYPMMRQGGLIKYQEGREVINPNNPIQLKNVNFVYKRPEKNNSPYNYTPQNLVPPSFNNLGQTTYSETTPIDVKKAEEDYKNKVIKGKAYVNKQNAKAIEFHKKWMSSPMYKEMLYKSDPINAETIEKNRWVNFNNINSNFNPIQKEDWEADSKNLTGNIQIYPIAVQKNVPGVGTHEFSHSIDRPKGFWNLLIGNRNIPNTDENKMYSYSGVSDFSVKPNVEKEWIYINNPNSYEYIAEPTETRARLNEIRQAAYENNLYDPFTQKVDANTFNKLLEFQFEKDETWSPLWELQDVYTDDQIIDLLNTVSKNNKVSLNPQMINNNSDWEIIG